MIDTKGTPHLLLRPHPQLLVISLCVVACSCGEDSQTSTDPKEDFSTLADPKELAKIVNAEIEIWKTASRKARTTKGKSPTFPTDRASAATDRLVALKPESETVIRELVNQHEGEERGQKRAAELLRRKRRVGNYGSVYDDFEVELAIGITAWLEHWRK